MNKDCLVKKTNKQNNPHIRFVARHCYAITSNRISAAEHIHGWELITLDSLYFDSINSEIGEPQTNQVCRTHKLHTYQHTHALT